MADEPNRPAYDNPVRNKGTLAEGNNAKKEPRPKPSNRPQGHESDKVLGRKPVKWLCHGNGSRGEGRAKPIWVSGSSDGCLPLRRRFGSEDPQCRSRNQVALKIEVVVDDSMDAEEALRGSG
jgi:hypothetical protein